MVYGVCTGRLVWTLLLNFVTLPIPFSRMLGLSRPTTMAWNALLWPKVER